MNLRNLYQRFLQLYHESAFHWSVLILATFVAAIIIGWSWWIYKEASWSETSFTTKQDTIVLNGKLSFSKIEGGCFSFETNDGKVFELYGEKAEEIKNTNNINKRIKIQGKIRDDLVSFCIARDGFLEVKSYKIIDELENSGSCGPKPPTKCSLGTRLLCVNEKWSCGKIEENKEDVSR